MVPILKRLLEEKFSNEALNSIKNSQYLLAMWKYNLTINLHCPHLHHEGTSVFAFCVTGPLSCSTTASIKSGYFSIVWYSFFFSFVFIQSINAPLKRVWFVLMKHCILLDFKQNIFKWYLDAVKMLLFTMKTITFMHQIEKSWNNRIGVKKLYYVIHGFLFSINANAFQCI